MFMVTKTSRKIISSKLGEIGVQPKIVLYPDSSLNGSSYSEVEVYASSILPPLFTIYFSIRLS